MLAIIFMRWCTNGSTRKKMRIGIYLYTLVWFIAKLTFENMVLYDTFTAPLKSFALLATGIYTLITLFGEERRLIYSDERFWVSVAVVLYNAGTLPLFALANMLLTYSLEVFAKMWTLNWTLIIISNVLYAIAFTSRGRPINEESLDNRS
ncbi:MAG TPA: hypothetical protein VI758_08830 [Bacteroidota bacterium]